jgi:hypothetical protein
MLVRLPIDLIVEIGILAGPDDYEELAKTSKRNAIILHKPHVVKATNDFIVKTLGKTLDRADYIIYMYKGERHSFNDMPAIICMNGSKEWYKHGKLHRDNDQPAVIFNNGPHAWFQYGKLHRDNDQPAIIYSNGTKDWYQHGKYIK